MPYYKCELLFGIALDEDMDTHPKSSREWFLYLILALVVTIPLFGSFLLALWRLIAKYEEGAVLGVVLLGGGVALCFRGTYVIWKHWRQT